MNKSKILLTIGVWVAILPYLGFPYVIKNSLFTLTGLILFYLAYLMYKENKEEHAEKHCDNFCENKHFEINKED